MFSMTLVAKLLLSAASGLTHVAVRGVAAVRHLVKAVAHRRDMHLLTEMDERALKDIGLVRSDVSGALATSWLSDPTAVLAARASERSGTATDRRERAVHQGNAARLRSSPDRGAAAAAPVTLASAAAPEDGIACCT